ncbi:MAG TPA: helix-turn-helix domain containing protein [Acidimicrobiia bacterium]|nr:helix-turn-helix domain containing protein [Acidimicrobiia bacterium]
MDLVGSYSNPTILLEKLTAVQACTGSRDADQGRVRQRQTQIHLTSDQVDDLITSHLDGESIAELAARFGIHRTTVMKHLDRAGVERRAGVIERHLERARTLYESGLSLAKVGEHFGVDGETVRQSLKRAGVVIRRRNGWT